MAIVVIESRAERLQPKSHRKPLKKNQCNIERREALIPKVPKQMEARSGRSQSLGKAPPNNEGVITEGKTVTRENGV